MFRVLEISGSVVQEFWGLGFKDLRVLGYNPI